MKKSFTMIEIVIAIVMLAILSVVSGVGLMKRMLNTRDNQRTIDMKGIEYGLKTFYLSNNYYPNPSDSSVAIIASGVNDIVGYQGNFGALNIRDLQVKGEFKDPLTKKYYTYLVNTNQDKYEIMGFMEGVNNLSYLNNVYAGLDYSTYSPKILGKALGILVQRQFTLPLQSVFSGNFNITNVQNNYDAYLNSGNKIVGSGVSLLNLIQFMRNSYDEPKACPVGFIPVPGNKDFQQAGFCVAKYEMKQITGSAGYYDKSSDTYVGGISEICSGGNYTPCPSDRSSDASPLLNGKIVSKADGQPIVRLNQATAIAACTAMGSGYHLITNNEWMSVARNIESQSVNWTLGKVGSGGIYRGKNYSRVGASDTDSTNLDCDDGTKANGTRYLPSISANANGAKCRLSNGRNKRELYLSNGQIIWDLAGNVYEHVNKANTINGTGYVSGSTTFKNFPTDLRVEWSSGDVSSTERSLYGPSSSLYDSIYGMGKISGNESTNVFVRGGAGWDSDGTGIYFLNLYYTSNNFEGNTGFRCAY